MCIGLVAALIAIDVWAGSFAPHIEPTERLVLNHTFYDQNSELSADISAIRQTNGYKIVALGDSTMYGALVYQNETIPYYLRQLLQHRNASISLYNLAFPGARPADLYAMLKWTHDAHPNLVVIDVNAVFFSQRLLDEAALANPNLKKEFLFEPVVPKGIFSGSRIDNIFATLVQNTNIGQYRTEINKNLFGKSLRTYVNDFTSTLHPTVKPQVKTTATLPAPVIGQGWREKNWNSAEQKNMARIYTQGPLTANNDSVKMLQAMIHYAHAEHIPVLFYVTPQNEQLIGRFFSLSQLNQNEDYLVQLMRREGAWYVDLRHSVPTNQFADYDHMLKGGDFDIAKRPAGEIERKGGLPK